LGLFPNPIRLKAGEKYTARLKRGITGKDVEWSFKVAPEGVEGRGDTSVPMGFTVQKPLPDGRGSVGFRAATVRERSLPTSATKSKGEQH